MTCPNKLRINTSWITIIFMQSSSFSLCLSDVLLYTNFRVENCKSIMLTTLIKASPHLPCSNIDNTFVCVIVKWRTWNIEHDSSIRSLNSKIAKILIQAKMVFDKVNQSTPLSPASNAIKSCIMMSFIDKWVSNHFLPHFSASRWEISNGIKNMTGENNEN